MKRQGNNFCGSALAGASRLHGGAETELDEAGARSPAHGFGDSLQNLSGSFGQLSRFDQGELPLLGSSEAGLVKSPAGADPVT